MSSQPKPSTFATYFQRYTGLVADGPVTEVIKTETEASLAFWQSIDASQTEKGYAPGKWSLKELLQHVIDTERIFQYRALCISRGEKENLPGFDHDAYVEQSAANNRPWSDILAEWEALRQSTLWLFKSLNSPQLEQSSTAGGNTLSALACGYILAGHEKHHRNIATQKYLS